VEYYTGPPTAGELELIERLRGREVTPEHLEVIELIAAGYLQPEVAARLHLAYDTVKSRVRRLRELAAYAQLVEITGAAVLGGLVEPPAHDWFAVHDYRASEAVRGEPLAPDERDVFARILAGQTGPTIHRLTGFGINKVKYKFAIIYTKIGARNAYHAAGLSAAWRRKRWRLDEEEEKKSVA